MCKNILQFQYGQSLPDFLNLYGAEKQCEAALLAWKWPQGFRCPRCGGEHFCVLHKRTLYQCSCCHRQTSLISNTIFSDTKLPLTQWFLGMYFLTQNKTGLSAMNLHRLLGISYNAAWRMKHKLMQVMMERNHHWILSGRVEIDDAYWGGEKHGGKRGRGSENKAPFIAAVQTDEAHHPLYMRFSAVNNFRRVSVQRWAEHSLALGTVAVSDGLPGFQGIKDAGCYHTPMVTGGGYRSMSNEQFTWVNTLLGNVKRALNGTYHAFHVKHLPRYLAEFNYRFNRRFDLTTIVKRLGRIAASTAPMPERLLKLADIQW